VQKPPLTPEATVVAAAPARPRTVRVLAAIVVVHALYFAWAHANQPPLDVHAFRQSQTALTALWFMKQGLSLAYETPVVGAPWSIPFEFPLFQALAASLARLLHAPLDATGRLLSFAFLVATLAPARDLVRTLELPKSTFIAFCVLLLGSPVYLYWGRTFLIETTALFFVTVAVACYARVFRGGGVGPMLLMSLAATLGFLQKATTALPVVLVLGCLHAVLVLRALRQGDMRLAAHRVIAGLLMFVVPAVVGYAWVHYSDAVKAHNEVGRALTSAALATWNWGTMNERFSAILWVRGMGIRILAKNLGLIVGPALILWSAMTMPRGPRTVMWLACALAVVPLLMFPNLHIRHEYYHAGSLVYPLFAAALATGWLLEQGTRRAGAASLGLALILVANVAVLDKSYLHHARAEFTAQNSRDFAVGTILKRELPESSGFVAFGNDWSSTFAYVAERKSFNVPAWFTRYDEVLGKPSEFLGNTELGAVVVCAAPESQKILDPFLSSPFAGDKGWALGETQGCVIAAKSRGVPLVATAGNPPVAPTACAGQIELAGRAQVAEDWSALVVRGWTVTEVGGPAPSDEIYIALQDKDGGTEYLKALWTHPASRPVPQGVAGVPHGFSRVLSGHTRPGVYRVNLVRKRGGAVYPCSAQTGRELRVE
jgi:hypothetical protein